MLDLILADAAAAAAAARAVAQFAQALRHRARARAAAAAARAATPRPPPPPRRVVVADGAVGELQRLRAHLLRLPPLGLEGTQPRVSLRRVGARPRAPRRPRRPPRALPPAPFGLRHARAHRPSSAAAASAALDAAFGGGHGRAPCTPSGARGEAAELLLDALRLSFSDARRPTASLATSRQPSHLLVLLERYAVRPLLEGGDRAARLERAAISPPRPPPRPRAASPRTSRARRAASPAGRSRPAGRPPVARRRPRELELLDALAAP